MIIWRFELDINENGQVIETPDKCRFLSAHKVKNRLVIFAVVEMPGQMVKRTIRIFNTGEEMKVVHKASRLNYLNSIEVNGDWTKHVFWEEHP